jgi:hypothetical protein
LVIPYRNWLNDRGQVAAFGYNSFLGDETGLLWDDTLQLLPSWDSATVTRPRSLNDAGQIVGLSGPSQLGPRAVR